VAAAFRARGYQPRLVSEGGAVYLFAQRAPWSRFGVWIVHLSLLIMLGGGIAGLRGAVGTPAQVREYLRRYEAAGVDQIIFVSQSGKTRHEDIMESLELFGREVLPEFKDRDAAAALAARIDAREPIGPEDVRVAEDLFARYPEQARGLLESALASSAMRERAARRFAEATALLERAAAVAPARDELGPDRGGRRRGGGSDGGHVTS